MHYFGAFLLVTPDDAIKCVKNAQKINDLNKLKRLRVEQLQNVQIK